MMCSSPSCQCCNVFLKNSSLSASSKTFDYNRATNHVCHYSMMLVNNNLIHLPLQIHLKKRIKSYQNRVDDQSVGRKNQGAWRKNQWHVGVGDDTRWAMHVQVPSISPWKIKVHGFVYGFKIGDALTPSSNSS